jgi:hypothetical protein
MKISKFSQEKSFKKTSNVLFVIYNLKTKPPQIRIYKSYVEISLKLTVLTRSSPLTNRRKFSWRATAASWALPLSASFEKPRCII